MIYAAQTFAGAMLEILVHSNLYRLPKVYVYIEIRIPDNVSTEHLNGVDRVPGDVAGKASVNFGDRWLQEGRSAVLVVPSIVTGGVETNVLFNPAHPDFGMILAGDPKPVLWDSRFFTGNRQ